MYSARPRWHDATVIILGVMMNMRDINLMRFLGFSESEIDVIHRELKEVKKTLREYLRDSALCCSFRYSIDEYALYRDGLS